MSVDIISEEDSADGPEKRKRPLCRDVSVAMQQKQERRTVPTEGTATTTTEAAVESAGAAVAAISRCYDKWKRCEVISLCEREVKS